MKMLFENWRRYINETDIKERVTHHGWSGRCRKNGVDGYFDADGKCVVKKTETDQSLEEAGDPDSKADNSPEPAEVAKALERSTIEKAIEDFSFNSAQGSQHRWGRGQPIIDYRFDDGSGTWAYTATIPDDSSNADNWPSVKSEEGEDLNVFLTRVKESPTQLNLGV